MSEVRCLQQPMVLSVSLSPQVYGLSLWSACNPARYDGWQSALSINSGFYSPQQNNHSCHKVQPHKGFMRLTSCMVCYALVNDARALNDREQRSVIQQNSAENESVPSGFFKLYLIVDLRFNSRKWLPMFLKLYRTIYLIYMLDKNIHQHFWGEGESSENSVFVVQISTIRETPQHSVSAKYVVLWR